MDNNLTEAYKNILDALFAKFAETITDCQGNRLLVAEHVDGINLTLEHFEVVLRELVSSGAILAKPSAQQLAEAEYQRSKAERKRRMDFNDDLRNLRKMPREQWELEMKKRRAAEAAANREATAAEEKRLRDMSPEELRKLVRAQSVAHGKRPAPIRDGEDGQAIW